MNSTLGRSAEQGAVRLDKDTNQPPLNSDEWRTFKRVLPRDVHEEMKFFERFVAEHSGLPPRYEGIGASVSVWSIITEHLRNTTAGLEQLAAEWKKANE